jgi:hypothetical protein
VPGSKELSVLSYNSSGSNDLYRSKNRADTVRRKGMKILKGAEEQEENRLKK